MGTGASFAYQSDMSMPFARHHAPPRSLLPQSGDVVISRRTARADAYAVSIVPAQLRLRLTRYTDAIEKGRDLALRARVDAWFTCDHTNYVQVGAFRKE